MNYIYKGVQVESVDLILRVGFKPSTGRGYVTLAKKTRTL